MWVRSQREEGISIASDVKVEGEDLATPGSLRVGRARGRVGHRGDAVRVYVLLHPPLRKSRDRNDSPIIVK